MGNMYSIVIHLSRGYFFFFGGGGGGAVVHRPQATVYGQRTVGSLLSFLRAHCDCGPRRSGVSAGRRCKWPRGMAALCRGAATFRFCLYFGTQNG